MKRRNFLRKLPLLAGAPMMLNSIPIQAMARNSELHRLAASSLNDKVLVLIQLHGGNDGLNMLVPIDQYASYYNMRPNIAIPETGNRSYLNLDSTLPVQDQVGVHPDMLDLKALYDEARVNIVQSVAYENINGSHFRSRDIWFMGGDYDEYKDSGWMGRYLDHVFPGYPDDYPNPDMPDPLAIEIGSSVSLAFHTGKGIPASLSINNPNRFYDLITTTGGEPPESIKNSHYGEELRWIMGMEEKSDKYADRLYEIWQNTSEPNVTYPEQYPMIAPSGIRRNGLAQQLKMIARLLSGGIKTKIFLARIGGFDTHASQVEASNPTYGLHAALLYHIGSAMRAFQKDLKDRGIEDRVLSMTFSEFGRRAESNGSYGTDHGKAAPMLVFGKGVNPGITGTNPDLNNLDRGNVRMQYDYRQVFTSALIDWLEADPDAVAATEFSEWSDNRLPLIGGRVTGVTNDFIKKRWGLKSCYPNPVQTQTVIGFRINAATDVKIDLLDVKGSKVSTLIHKKYSPGEHSEQIDLSQLPSGTYFYRLKTPQFTESKQLIKM
jgi:uncharacterized protein (DUF1501 family)